MGAVRRHKPIGWILLLCLALTACGLPHLQPVAPERQSAISSRCQRVFLQSPWQMVHSIRTVLPNGEQQTAMAVIQVCPDTPLIRCVMMSIEGIVLFEGRYDGDITVNRAIPPFDEEKFAETLFSDIRLAFCPPEAHAEKIGLLESRTPGCRYQIKDGGFVEVALKAESSWTLRRYSSRGRRQQTIEASLPRSENNAAAGAAHAIPESIKIVHHGLFSYTLTLDLIRAKPLEAADPP